MTNPEKAFIGVLVDRSGSMQVCKDDMEGGLNALIEQQAQEPGSAELSLAQFDTEYEVLCDFVPLANAPKYTLMPRGGTALLDAMARFIIQVGEQLAALPENDRPGTVIIHIITDGMENSSREWTDKSRVKELVEHQKHTYGWKFIFLGANMDAVAEGYSLGIDKDASLTWSPDNARGAYALSGGYVSAVRSGKAARFTDEDRKRAVSKP
jgi:uncharacterized protein YegL